MVGSFITRALTLVLGYAYPAYDCYKTVELNRPEVEQLRFWCQYWILLALLTTFERVADNFISWLPMYGEAKLAFIVYLWYPRTRGTTYVYDTFFKPYIAKHETEIDRNLLELKTRAGDMAVLYFQKAASYSQTRFYEVLQYVASQSQTPRPRPPQRQQQQEPPPRTRHVNPGPPPVPTPSAPPQPLQMPRVPPSPSGSQMQEQPSAPGAPSVAASPVQPPASTGSNRVAPSGPEVIGAGSRNIEAMQVDLPGSLANNEPNPSAEETIMEEAIRVTRARLRKRIAGSGPPPN